MIYLLSMFVPVKNKVKMNFLCTAATHHVVVPKDISNVTYNIIDGKMFSFPPFCGVNHYSFPVLAGNISVV